MKIEFQSPDKVNGLMTITMEPADYQEQVNKALKDLRKKANMPGFRPGMVPMGLIKRQYGPSVKMDEINKILGREMYKYINDNNIKMLGEPMANEAQKPQDMEKEDTYTFVFDVAVAPEFEIKLDKKDKINFYEIKIDDELIDKQVDMYTSRNGHYEKVDVYEPELRDMLKGDLRQLDADGNTLEGGITVEAAVMMPQYIKVEDQKALFDGAKLGDIITFNPKKAYPDNDVEVASLLKVKREEVAELTSDFSYQITEISRFVKAEVNQELFDNVYGPGAVADEKAFRERIAEELRGPLASNADFQLLQDVRRYAEKKVGELTFPEELLKRVMKRNNEDKAEDYVDKNFDASIRELKWHLIKEQLVSDAGIKIEDEDVRNAAKEAARMQFAQYGMNNVPEDYLDNYATEMLKKRENVDGFVDRAIDARLTQAVKDMVTLVKKTVTLDEFNKLMSE